jgi:uncharacterized protein YndB with AHSA1/START domain
MVVKWPAARRRVVVCGPRPAAEVWDCYVRPHRWPQWSPQIQSVDYPEATIKPDTTGVVHGPFGLPVAFRILAVDASPPVLAWSWSATVAGVSLLLEHTVEAIGVGTRTTLTVQGFAPAVLGYLPLARLALRRLVGPER